MMMNVFQSHGGHHLGRQSCHHVRPVHLPVLKAVCVITEKKRGSRVCLLGHIHPVWKEICRVTWSILLQDDSSPL